MTAELNTAKLPFRRWAGLPNLFWMADREKGVVNMVMSQVVPFNDPKTLTPWLAAEKVVYDSLA